MKIDTEQCNRDVRTYGDVIRHMTNGELAFFLEQMHANIELGILAVMRAKMYPHRKCGEDMKIDSKSVRAFYSFMEHRVTEEEENYGDIWGVENWQDLVQWESKYKKNFEDGRDFIEEMRKEYVRNMRNPKLYEAVNCILNFITSCSGDMRTLITPDGEKISVDCDNLLEDLGNIGKHAMGTMAMRIDHFAEAGKMV